MAAAQDSESQAVAELSRALSIALATVSYQGKVIRQLANQIEELKKAGAVHDRRASQTGETALNFGGPGS